jgi:hypothetical protein
MVVPEDGAEGASSRGGIRMMVSSIRLTGLSTGGASRVSQHATPRRFTAASSASTTDDYYGEE